MELDRKDLAERLFRGVYGGDPSVVDELAGQNIVASYPIFEKLFDTPSIRGREAYKHHATNFGNTWTNAQITIYKAIAEGNQVVLLWGFRVRRIGPAALGIQPTSQEHAWGGITLFRFDEAGKIVAEIGEESAPGPIGRLATGPSPR